MQNSKFDNQKINNIKSSNNKKTSRNVIIGLFIIILIIIAIIFIFNMVKKDSENNVFSCESDNCHRLNIYFLENNGNNELEEKYQSFLVDDGTILYSNDVVNHLNEIFGYEILATDGETFQMTMSGFTIDVAWYYKDTNTKFDFNEPITEDTEIEMKMFNGSMGNDFFENIFDIFPKNK